MSPSWTSSGIFRVRAWIRFSSTAFQREKFSSSRPSFTSCATSHEMGAILVCQPQTVSFEWQSQHAFSSAALTDGDVGTCASTGGFVRSMFVPSDRLEWFLAPTVPNIKWGRIEYSRSGKNFAITDPLVEIPNPAIDKGTPLPTFNDDYKGAAPDIGAFENGRPPLRFGREAAPGFARAPWEVY